MDLEKVRMIDCTASLLAHELSRPILICFFNCDFFTHFFLCFHICSVQTLSGRLGLRCYPHVFFILLKNYLLKSISMIGQNKTFPPTHLKGKKRFLGKGGKENRKEKEAKRGSLTS